MKSALAIIVGFVHDFATGCWAATVLGIWWVERVMLGEPTAELLLTSLQRQFFWIGIGCTLVVLATGAGRGFSYVDNQYGAAAESQRRKLLIGKHVILLAVFGAGTWSQYQMAFG